MHREITRVRAYTYLPTAEWYNPFVFKSRSNQVKRKNVRAVKRKTKYS
jgi:hypothetical protein